MKKIKINLLLPLLLFVFSFASANGNLNDEIINVFGQNVNKEINSEIFEKPHIISDDYIYEMKSEYIKVPEINEVLFFVNKNTSDIFKVIINFKDLDAKERKIIFNDLNNSLQNKYSGHNDYKKFINGNVELNLKNGKIKIMTSDSENSNKKFVLSLVYELNDKYKKAFEKYL
jgi:hypothetical protein